MKKPQPRPLSDLVHAHVGRPALVMGGGLSLPEHVAHAPANSVFISANQHGCLVRKCDYIVAADGTEEMKTWPVDGRRLGIWDHGAPIISMRRNLADFVIFQAPVNNSGVIATWVAWVMGCAPILLAAMDCYQGGTYHHDPKAQSSGRSQTLSQHLDKWRALTPHVPGAMIRAMGGILVAKRVFTAYDPGEPAADPHPAEDIRARVKGARVRVMTAWRLHPYRYDAGDEIEVNNTELARGMREKKVKRIGA